MGKDIHDSQITLGKDVVLEVEPLVVPKNVEIVKNEGGALKKAKPPKRAGAGK